MTVVLRLYQSPETRDLALPSPATSGAAGMDLRAAPPAEHPLVIEPGRWALVPTGLRVEIPPGHEAQVRPRSGLAFRHGVTVLNSPGTIDEDYRGEIGVILINHGAEPFIVQRGDRIAQMVICPVVKPGIVSVETAEELQPTARGEGGFGHTGAG